MPYYISPPPQNPVVRIIASIVAVLTLAGAFMVGMAALVVVVGVGLVAALTIWIRIALLRRSLRKNGPAPAAKSPFPEVDSNTVKGQVIEAEYTVISKRKE